MNKNKLEGMIKHRQNRLEVLHEEERQLVQELNDLWKTLTAGVPTVSDESQMSCSHPASAAGVTTMNAAVSRLPK